MQTPEDMSCDPSALRERIVLATLACAAQDGWEATTLSRIAQESGVSLAVLNGCFDDRSEILAAYGRMVDRHVLALSDDLCGAQTSMRDRLFDLLMERFERLNADRAGIVAILQALRYDPGQIVITLPHLAKSMNWMMEAAGLSSAGVRGAVRLAGLTGLYLRVLSKTWVTDETPDLSHTMSALDSALGRAENLAEIFGFAGD